MSTTCHTPNDSASARVLKLARGAKFVTRRDIAAAGIYTQALSRLVKDGALERVSRGRYRLPDAPVTEHHGLALVAAAVPRGIVCLISALNFHRIGTQLPAEV
jgi:predicted transcriptional regulator of viral defense system